MLSLVLSCCLTLSCTAIPFFTYAAEDKHTPIPPNTQNSERGERPHNPEEWEKRRQEREWRRVVENNPAMANVDPTSAEGQAALTAERERRMQEHATEMQERLSQNQAAYHESLRGELGFDAETFSAIEPLLARVESLQMQRSLTTMGTNPMMRMRSQGGDDRRGRRFDPSRMAQMFLGDTELDPSVAACTEAMERLNALVSDEQASQEEVALAVEALRNARKTFTDALDGAQDELRSVLTPRQEALLLSKGILD